MKEYAYFETLVNKWLSQQLTDVELQELMKKLSEERYRDQFASLFASCLQDGSFSEVLSEDMVREAYGKVSNKPAIYTATGAVSNTINTIPPVHRIHFLRRAWFRVAVSILIILTTGFFLYDQFVHTSGSGQETAIKPSPDPNILPGKNKATLTLADGSKIILDNAATGKLAQETGATIRKSADGEIIYAFDESTVSKSVVYNTMSTPRGGQYQLVLPDGSKVWLNAESSVTFPTTFTGNAREIRMTGEAYFEVKPDAVKPFIVKTVTDEIQVLGTSFNISAYHDAPVKTSLLEGKVKVNEKVLFPGQAFLKGAVRSTDMSQDIAWKNGLFNFNELSLQQALPQLARWYDIDIEYTGKIPSVTLLGEIERNLSLQQVLVALKQLGVKAELVNRTLKIYP